MAGLASTSSAVACGVTSSSLSGQKLAIAHPNLSLPRASPRAGVAVAKYGEKSMYFDLEDIGSTTGSWDLYGADGPSPYNGLQSKFFETTAGAFTRRGILLKFLVLGGGGTLAYVSSTAGKVVLPINKGPQGPPQLGPRGKI